MNIKIVSEYDGEEVVQLYFRDSYSSVTRPVKELIRYERVFVKSGETISVNFDIELEELAFYDINMNYCVEKGEFEFMIGSSSDDKMLKTGKVMIDKRYDF